MSSTRSPRAPSPTSSHALGATYHTGRIERSCPHPDVVIECTGVASLVFDAMEHLGPGGVACLTGVSGGKHALKVDASMLNRSMVLENQVVVGSVNANHRHYEAAAEALTKADRAWISKLVTRRVPLEHWPGRAGPTARRRQGGDRGRHVTTSEIAPGNRRDRHPPRRMGEGDGGLSGARGAPVLVETGSQSSVGVLLDALDTLGVSPNALAGVAVTHIHLDHARGVGDVARAFPAATVYVHEKGARHLVDPTRLIDSASRVYGPLLDSLYGRLDATPAERSTSWPTGRRSACHRTGCSPPSTPPDTPSTISPCTTR